MVNFSNAAKSIAFSFSISTLKSDLIKENSLDKNSSNDYKDKFIEFKKKHNMSKGQEKEISKKRTFGLEK